MMRRPSPTETIRELSEGIPTMNRDQDGNPL